MIALTLLLSAPLLAQDEGGSEPFGGIDIDLSDIDLGDGGGSSSSSSSAPAQSQTYSGGVTEKRVGVAREDGTAGAIQITHSGGTISVRCQDTEDLTARIDYVIEGTNAGQMESVGRGIGISVWGDSNNAGVKTRVPYRGSGITEAQIPLVVSAPRNARLTVAGSDGWIEVLNCEGTVKATTRSDGIFASGTYSQFDLSTGTGNIKLKLDSSSEITANSKASSAQGDVYVELPLTSAVDISATGESVNVLHSVNNGSVTGTAVSGEIGGGGASVRLQAKGSVEVQAP